MEEIQRIKNVYKIGLEKGSETDDITYSTKNRSDFGTKEYQKFIRKINEWSQKWKIMIIVSIFFVLCSVLLSSVLSGNTTGDNVSKDSLDKIELTDEQRELVRLYREYDNNFNKTSDILNNSKDFNIKNRCIISSRSRS